MPLLEDLFGQPKWAVRLERKVDKLMATFEEAKQEVVDFITGLQAENAQLRQSLADAQVNAQNAADALAAFQADDAATDAAQLAEQAQAFADDLKATVDALKPPQPAPEVPENPVPEPEVSAEPEVPAEETPAADQPN